MSFCVVAQKIVEVIFAAVKRTDLHVGGETNYIAVGQTNHLAPAASIFRCTLT